MDRVTKRIDENYACYTICENQCPDGIYYGNKACMCTASMKALAKLLHYEDMEEQGKLVILPCNINDRVHTFYNSDIEWCFEVGMNIEEILEDMCEERRVTGFDVRDDGLWIILNGGIFNPDDRIPAEEFGKTVFLTKQEEIEALERMKGE